MSGLKGQLGSTEIEILRYVGDNHPITVGETAEHFAQTTGQARTTVLTTMERLRRKGYLVRRRVAGVFRYSPKLAKEDLLRGLVEEFVDTKLGGSISPFVAYLSEGGSVSEEDLDVLKRLVSEMERQMKGDRS